jgi:hypothetical protein
MKIILSRKGFDATHGAIPSPILPDGALLSMPIPCETDSLAFSDLRYGESTYADILRQLAPKARYASCHLDPDIREGVRAEAVEGWKPAFGQIDAAQGYLRNSQIQAGDLFLFFGRFRKMTGDIANGTLMFDKRAPIIHIIYGYMEIGEIIASDKIAERGYSWHPHCYGERLNNNTNTLYIPAETLSFDKNRSGWGVFAYSENLILTLADKTAIWREIPALMPGNISSNKKNSAIGQGIYYKGIWQEMVLKENSVSEEWAKSIFQQAR